MEREGKNKIRILIKSSNQKRSPMLEGLLLLRKRFATLLKLSTSYLLVVILILLPLPSFPTIEDNIMSTELFSKF